MPIDYEQMKTAAAQLYRWSLTKVPDDTVAALRKAMESEQNEIARQTLLLQLRSAELAGEREHYVCSDAGVPVYLIKVGTQVRFSGPVSRAIKDAFADLVETIDPPLLQHVTNPLTNERGYAGKDMPLVTWEMVDDCDYVEMVCQPKALGSGRWAALEILSYPTLAQIEEYVVDVIIRAGSQHCPPVIIGVGIGGDFDTAAKMAKQSTLRKIGSINPDPMLAAMEERLLAAANATGFGPMGTGGSTSALAVHIDYAAGHGYTPVAVSFNCWINRRTRARLRENAALERME
jgi:fumarate hydratase subunit alpha